MAKIVDEFEHAHEYQNDVWVADYTEQTRFEPEDAKKGVCLSESEFDDIMSFHLQNPKHVVIYGVNFEEYPDFFPEKTKNCECLFKPRDVVDGGFLLLCELKYCRAHNIEENADKAYEQLKSTWSHLESKQIFDRNHCKSFFNISVPDHSDRSPFKSFTASQDEELKWLKEYKINLLGENDLLILDKGIIRIPETEI